MVSLDDLVEAEKEPRICQVCDWLETLPVEVRESFDKHVERGTATAPLHRACRKLDPPVPVAYQQFRRHIVGSCQLR